MVDAKEMSESLDLEYLFSRESITYKVTRGASGIQLNLRVCPECDDSRYRVYLNAETGVGNCFVCNARFNKLSYVKSVLQLGWGETFKVCEQVLREQGWRPKRKIEAAVELGDVVLPISTPLPLPEGNIEYLEARGFNGEIARYFHLRYCEFGWFVSKDFDGKSETQDFSSRIIIPVFDLDGSLKTFQGRDLLAPVDKSKSEPGVYVRQKYLFPKGLPGTGRYLFNGQNVILTKEVALGEGVFDVAAMKVAFDAVSETRHIVPIGSFGKHLSYGSSDGDDQLGRFIKLKAAGVTTVTIMWDGEAKALVAALEAGKMLTRIGLIARIALLPADRDPNEVLPEVVRDAYFKAEVWTLALDIKLRIRNPYSNTGRRRA